MKKIISYKNFINRIIFTTVAIIAVLFIIYGYFIQSRSIKENLKNETSLFVDLIFENLYTAMQKGATKEDLDRIIADVEKKISHSSIHIYQAKDITKDNYIKDIFSSKKSDLFYHNSFIDFARPILFQEKCLACHTDNKEGEIAAVIRLEFSIFDLNISLKDILVMMSILFLISMSVFFIVWYKYLHKAFISPIENLIKQMINISEYKDLKKEIKIDSNIQEVKKLESVFNVQNNKLRLAYEKLEDISNIDTLTQIYNRKKFNEYISEEIELLQRYDYNLSLILIDLNKFKFINDTYGHDMGDLVLVEFTKLITKHIRRTDKFFRIGGDEFVLILSHTDKKQAQIVIQTLKSIIKNFTLVYEDISLSFSVSFGVSSYKEDADNLQELFKIADKKMYEEKRKL